MKIHVVSEGESIWLIAREYGVTAEAINRVNGLEDLPCIVPGQALIIPLSQNEYVTKDNETIQAIGEKFNISPDRIMEFNDIHDENSIEGGVKLKIPESQGSSTSMEINGYILPSIPDREKQIIHGHKKHLTSIMPFSCRAGRDGEVHSIEDKTILYESKSCNIVPVLVVTNQNTEVFDKDLVHYILNNETVKQNLIVNILNILRNKGYSGLNIDFEKIPSKDRESYNKFLKQAANVLHAEGYTLSVSLVPKAYDIESGTWHGAHDYKSIGEIADYVITMTYEWGWPGGPPLAVSPLDQVKKVIDYTISLVPSHKVMMGMALYGYDWLLPFIPGGSTAKRVSPYQALYIAGKHDSFIQYDERAKCPYFNYTDDNKKRHTIWFEDARSIEEKLKTAMEYKLRGISYWILGNYFPQNWYVLEKLCVVKKL